MINKIFLKVNAVEYNYDDNSARKFISQFATFNVYLYYEHFIEEKSLNLAILYNGRN